MSRSSLQTVRELARRVAGAAHSERNERIRRLWIEHNALRPTRPMVACRIYPPPAWEIVDPPLADDQLERQIETLLRILRLKIDLGDDEVFEPWLSLPAVFQSPTLFGITFDLQAPKEYRGASRYCPVVEDLEDIERIRTPDWRVDEEATAEMKGRAEEILDGILAVRIDRLRLLGANLGYYAQGFAGITELAYGMADRPAFVHALMAHLQRCIRDYLVAAERGGMLSLNNTGAYSASALCTDDLPQPGFDGRHVRLRDLWAYTDAQEFGSISPAMTEEFLFDYTVPILGLFGLNHYGCCEAHHKKWHLVRRIPNLRRVSVSPWQDLAEAVEEMGGRATLDWRVNVANVVALADPDAMRAEISRGLQVASGCPIEIVLQDVETVYGRKDTLLNWTRVAREEAERHA